MYFLYPLFALTGLLIAVPILVHLFNFKRFKRMDFTMVPFLVAIQNETKSQRKLKHFLILCSRILLFLALILAFMQPFFKEESSSSNRALALAVDNSLSIDFLPGQLDIIKRKVRKKIQSSSLPSVFLATSEGKGFQEMSKEQALSYIDALNLTPETANFQGWISNAMESSEAIGSLHIYSDFPESMELEEISDSFPFALHIEQFQPELKDRIWIDSAWIAVPFLDSRVPVELICRLKRNYKETGVQQKVNFYVDGSNRGFLQSSFGDAMIVQDTFRITFKDIGGHRVHLELDATEKSFDNDYYLNIDIPEQLSILCLKDKELHPFVKAMISNINYFSIDTVDVSSVDYFGMKKYDAIILDRLENVSTGLVASIQEVVQNGTDLFVIPVKDPSLESYRFLDEALKLDPYRKLLNLQSSSAVLELGADAYTGVFEKGFKQTNLKDLNFDWTLLTADRVSKEVLLKDNFGKALISKYYRGLGKVIRFNLDMSKESGFYKHSLFFPMLYNLLLASKETLPSSIEIGRKHIALPTDYESSQAIFTSDRGKWNFPVKSFRRKPTIFLNGEFSKGGFYSLNDSMGLYAFNTSRLESIERNYETDYLSSVARQKGWYYNQIDSMADVIENSSAGSMPLWKVLLIFALLLVLVEIALIKLL